VASEFPQKCIASKFDLSQKRIPSVQWIVAQHNVRILWQVISSYVMISFFPCRIKRHEVNTKLVNDDTRWLTREIAMKIQCTDSMEKISSMTEMNLFFQIIPFSKSPSSRHVGDPLKNWFDQIYMFNFCQWKNHFTLKSFFVHQGKITTTKKFGIKRAIQTWLLKNFPYIIKYSILKKLTVN